MYFHRVIGIISILSIVVSAQIINSDLTLPFDDPIPQDTSLPFDQIALGDNPLDPPLDLTSSLFDADLSSTDALKGFELSANPETNPSERLWDACSASDILPISRKSRVKRIDGTLNCPNPAVSGDSPGNSNVPPLMLHQTFDQAKHSLTCWALTLGLLPFAVASSGDGYDIINDRSILHRVTSSEVQYSPSTLYRATISMPKKKNLISVQSRSDIC